MKQKILEFDWDALIKREPYIDKACINFTNLIFLCQKSVFLDERLLLDVIKFGSIQIFGGRYVHETDSAENT
jgi:hypothetical protein